MALGKMELWLLLERNELLLDVDQDNQVAFQACHFVVVTCYGLFDT